MHINPEVSRAYGMGSRLIGQRSCQSGINLLFTVSVIFIYSFCHPNLSFFNFLIFFIKFYFVGRLSQTWAILSVMFANVVHSLDVFILLFKPFTQAEDRDASDVLEFLLVTADVPFTINNM